MNEMPTQLLEPEDLMKMPDGDRYELIDGVPVEKHLGAESDEIGGLLLTHLVTFVRKDKLGRVFGAKTSYVCFPSDPKLVRLPDVSFIAKGRLKDDRAPKGHITIAPDPAVEVVSPRDPYVLIETKVKEYRSAGVKLIWVITPETKTVLIRRLDGTCSELDENGTLSGEDVLPGFACPVAELFTR
jgi:Uma2 family endonuclease